MTMMVSQICAATRRSWVMKSTPTPVRCRTCSSSSSTCACTETSSADTASSATRISIHDQRARDADELALAAGELVRIAPHGVRAQAHHRQRFAGAPQRLFARHAEIEQASMMDSPTVRRGLSER